jgi:hypothetical protein
LPHTLAHAVPQIGCVTLPCTCAVAGFGRGPVADLRRADDQPDQQRQVAAEVQALAGRGELAAVVLEMAELPHRTSALPSDAG